MKFSSLFFVLAASAFFFFSCENSQEEIDALDRKNLMIDQATEIESYLSQGGKTKAKLTAPFMLRVTADTNYTEFPNTLHVDFYNDADIADTYLDARYGKYYENYNKVYLRDSIRVSSTRGDTLYCEDLWWDQNKELFYTDKPVRQRSLSGQKIDGKDGLEATQDLKKITFKSNQAVFPVKEGDLPR
jgi:LPS export ABC transporter protein LptC